MRSCDGCREYRVALRGMRRSFAALAPVGARPDRAGRPSCSASAARPRGAAAGGAAAGGGGRRGRRRRRGRDRLQGRRRRLHGRDRDRRRRRGQRTRSADRTRRRAAKTQGRRSARSRTPSQAPVVVEPRGRPQVQTPAPAQSRRPRRAEAQDVVGEGQARRRDEGRAGRARRDRGPARARGRRAAPPPTRSSRPAAPARPTPPPTRPPTPDRAGRRADARRDATGEPPRARRPLRRPTRRPPAMAAATAVAELPSGSPPPAGADRYASPAIDYPEPLAHETLLVRRGRRSGLFTMVAVHSTARGPALGGCRMWTYDDSRSAVRDVLRLSRAMTFKAAVRGPPAGRRQGRDHAAPGRGRAHARAPAGRARRTSATPSMRSAATT